MKFIFLFLLSCFSIGLTGQSVNYWPSTVKRCNVNIAANTMTTSSSKEPSSSPSFVTDNLISENAPEFISLYEQNPSLEINLGVIQKVKGIIIHRKNNQELKNYYIFISEQPFTSDDPEALLKDSNVVNLHIASDFPSGTIFETATINAKYLKIQLRGEGVLSLLEVEVCNGEICNNGVDDDQDGLTDCSDDDCLPTPFIAVHHTYCKEQNIIVAGEGSIRFSQYRWQVCKMDGSNPVLCKETGLITASKIPELNVNQLMGTTLECGFDYEVRLILINDCNVPITRVEKFKIICKQAQLDYKDIAVCADNFNINATMAAVTNTCQSCTYQWMPGAYLNNDKAAYPVIRGSNYSNAFDFDYIVRAVTPEGCIYYDNVQVSKTSTKIVYQNSISEYCEYFVELHVETSRTLSESSINVVFLEAGNPHAPPVAGTLVYNSQGKKFVFRLPGDLDKLNPKNYVVRTSFSYPQNTLTFGSCNPDQKTAGVPNPNLFVGDFSFVMPNAFTPNGDEESDVFGPLEIRDENSKQVAHNAVKGRLRIRNRLGNVVYNSGWIQSPFNEPFDLNLMRWNGRNNNGGVPIMDVYIWILELENCDSGGVVEFTGEVSLIL